MYCMYIHFPWSSLADGMVGCWNDRQRGKEGGLAYLQYNLGVIGNNRLPYNSFLISNRSKSFGVILATTICPDLSNSLIAFFAS